MGEAVTADRIGTAGAPQLQIDKTIDSARATETNPGGTGNLFIAGQNTD